MYVLYKQLHTIEIRYTDNNNTVHIYAQIFIHLVSLFHILLLKLYSCSSKVYYSTTITKYRPKAECYYYMQCYWVQYQLPMDNWIRIIS